MDVTTDLSIKRVEDESIKNPRHWETVGFAISKLVLIEGDMSHPSPRLGCTGEFEIKTNTISVTGVDWIKLNSSIELSRYLNTKYIDMSNDPTKDASMGKFRIGHADTDIDRLLEDLICSMYPGEKSEASLRLCIDLHHRQYLRDILDLNSDKNNEIDDQQQWITMQFTIKLVPESVKNKSPIYLWSAMEKLEEGKELYKLAVELFQVRRYYDAFTFFRQAMTLCQLILLKRSTSTSEKNKIMPQNSSGEEKETNSDIFDETKSLNEKCVSNITACHFQWCNHRHVIFLATERLAQTEEKSLENDSKANSMKVKMLYRRGVSNSMLNNYDEAINDFNNLLLIEPSNKAAQHKLKNVKANRQNSDIKMSNAMKKLFQSC